MGRINPFRLRGIVSMTALALALSGCVGRGLPDITGSLGGSTTPVTEPQWRSELQTWQQRYDANQGDRTAAFRYARALRALGQNAQAVAVLQNIILRHPKDMELLGAFGRALMDAGQLKQAEEVLARAHLPERPDWRILSAQGAVADQLGDHQRAQGFGVHRAVAQVPDQQRDVDGPLAQCRQEHRDDSQAIEQILAEAATASLLAQCAVGGGDNARIGLEHLLATDRRELPGLKHA